ncbi:MAG TPA: zinc ABC transporter substrate-binding protein [Candidatus Saccharimonadales bacterium]|nr:zinc ABC transporter substrate-binding protein [Candidatus Saccharimonadales bacterium]
MRNNVKLAGRPTLQKIGGLLFLIILLGGIVALAWPNNTPSAGGNRLGVVAAENFWGDIASQIGGDHVHVTSIISDPTADPHLYESSAKDAGAVASAKVVIVNGLGYDDFMAKLIGATQRHQAVLTAAQILGVTDESANPHLWYNLPQVHIVASKIAGSFETADPGHAADYKHNLATFDQSLQALLRSIDEIKQKYADAPVAYTEPVPGYLLAAAGLDVKTPEGFAKSIEDGDDPSPADAQAMDALMTNKQIKVLLYNSQATSPVTEHVKQLARQAGIPVIGVTETLPPNEPSYQAWQQHQLDQLLKALQTK